MYENPNLLYIVPLIRHTIVVCTNSISPMVIGCFICVKINIVIILIDISNFVMSGGNLIKMLVLGINEMFDLSSEVLKGYSLFLIYKTNFFIKLLKLIKCQCDYIFCYLFLCYLVFSSSHRHLLITWLKLLSCFAKGTHNNKIPDVGLLNRNM